MRDPTSDSESGLNDRPQASPSAHSSREPAEPSPAEMALLEALRKKDEAAFTTLFDRYHPSLLRLARFYVSSRPVAEEVVQETWLGVIQGLDAFEGRSSLKTWIFRILINRAKTRAEREGRTIPYGLFWDASAEPGEAAVEPERFLPATHLE